MTTVADVDIGTAIIVRSGHPLTGIRTVRARKMGGVLVDGGFVASGDFRIICNEFCGIGHSTMLGKIYVVEK